MIIVVDTIVIDGRGFDQAIETTFVQVQAHHRVVGLLDGFVCYVCYDELEVRLLRLLWSYIQ